jgi:hypothetical protein
MLEPVERIISVSPDERLGIIQNPGALPSSDVLVLMQIIYLCN